MARDLEFDVTAKGDADDLTTMAGQIKEVGKELRSLDGKRAQASVALTGAEKAQSQARGIRADVAALDGKSARMKIVLDAASSAPAVALTRQLNDLDGKTARANVALTGAEAAEAKATGFAGVLRAIPAVIRSRIEFELDRSVADRIAGVSNAVQRLDSFSRAAVSGVSRLRSAASMIVDPSQIQVIASLSDAIANKFHRAVDLAEVGVGKLRTGAAGLRTSLLALGAAGSVGQVLGGLATSISELSGAALLAPAAILGIGTAYATVKFATMGFADALTGSAKKQKEAFAKMGAGAQGLVLTLRELGPAANAFRTAVQDTAIAGFSKQVQQLASTYLPVLKTGMVGVARELNGMTRNAVTAVMSMSQIDNVRTIIGNTGKALGNMQGTLANAVSGFLNLGAAGASWLPKMGTAIDGAAAKFERWTRQITADGSFDRWVKTGIAAARQLGTVIGNVAAIIGTVFSVLNANGQGLFATLVTLTGQLRAFVQSAQGTAVLQVLGQTLSVVSGVLSNVFGAALQAVGPILIALAPAVQALAVAIGSSLVSIINLAAPALLRFAEALSANPELLVGLARAAAAVVIGFGPMVAIIGVAATVLKGMLLLALVSAAMTQLGLSGTIVARVLTALTSPMALIRAAFPLIATAAGSLAASLGLAAGPIGVLIVGFAALYASSSQFREAANGVAAVLGNLFMRTLEQAGSILSTTVRLIGDFVSALGDALSGVADFGSMVASMFGPAGKAVEAALNGIFNVLGNLPGAALAAFAAFVVLGKIAPLFLAASAAAAGFSARLLAFSASSAAATAAVNGIGAVAGRASTVLASMGRALPLIGVALIAIGAAADAASVDFDGLTQKVAGGSLSIAKAIKQAEVDSQSGFAGFVNAIGEWRSGIDSAAVAAETMRQKLDEYRAALSPMGKLQYDVATAQSALNDAVVEFGQGSSQATAASGVLAAAQTKLDAANKAAAAAANDHRTAEQRLGDTLRDQVGAALDYADAVKRTADAHKDASDALKESGKDSAEYGSATRDLVRAMLEQANAAKKQAEALGGTEAGVRAYNQEILRAADLSTAAGRDAFRTLAGSLDQTTLNALSAAARMTGLRTEIMKLPDGKTVEVVVAADQGKLPDVKKEVSDFASKKYVGVVTVLAETENARGDMQKAVTFANGLTGTLKIFADDQPALLTVGQTKYTIDAATGTMKILGDPAPGEANLTGFKLKVDATTGVMTIEGNDGPVTVKTVAAKQRIDTSIGVMTIDGDPKLADGKTTAAVRFANGSVGTVTLDGNEKPVNGKINATVVYGNGQRVTIQLDPRDLVTPKIQSIPRTGETVWTIRYVQDGNAVGGNVGNRTVLYSGGGIVPLHAASGLVLGGYAPGKDTVPAMLSPGEAVLVPELVRSIGPQTILAANLAASGRQPSPAARGTGWASGDAVSRTMTVRQGAGPSGAGLSAAALIGETRAQRAELGQMRGDLQRMTAEIRKQRPVVVQDHSGNPTETGRAAALAVRLA